MKSPTTRISTIWSAKFLCLVVVSIAYRTEGSLRIAIKECNKVCHLLRAMHRRGGGLRYRSESPSEPGSLSQNLRVMRFHFSPRFLTHARAKIGQDDATCGNSSKVISGYRAEYLGRALRQCARLSPPWTGSVAAGPAPGPAAILLRLNCDVDDGDRPCRETMQAGPE